MASWTGIVLALTERGDDEMMSRLSTYLHPIAGRPLCWHTVAALATQHPRPERLVVCAGPEIGPEMFAELPVEVEVVPATQPLREAVRSGGAPVLLVEAAAPGAASALPELIGAPTDVVLQGGADQITAAWLTPERAAEVLDSGGLAALNSALLEELRVVEHSTAFAVRDRHTFSQVSVLLRDQVVRRLMAHGVTFLLPDSVLVDVDVQIGRDTVIYPGVVLEGQTQIGEETVVGPGCRIIDSWIGSGVELKGWNFISRSSVRNRAILEPYVRRGFD